MPVGEAARRAVSSFSPSVPEREAHGCDVASVDVRVRACRAPRGLCQPGIYFLHLISYKTVRDLLLQDVREQDRPGLLSQPHKGLSVLEKGAVCR